MAVRTVAAAGVAKRRRSARRVVEEFSVSINEGVQKDALAEAEAGAGLRVAEARSAL